MKKGPEHPDAVRKKLVGEYLRNADRLLKNGDYDQALTEVEKSLELEPGNFYAQAYKERINGLRERHSRTAGGIIPPAAGTIVTKPAPPPAPKPAAPEPEEIKPVSALPGETEPPGPGPDEISAGPVAGTGEAPPAGGKDIGEMRQQIERDRATNEDEADRRAEEFARKGLEEELRQREERDRLKTAGQQALADALSGVHDEAVADLVARSKDAFANLLQGGDTEGAFRELSRIAIVDPGHAGLDDLSRRLADATAASAASGPPTETKTAPKEIMLQWFGKLLRSAWSEGTPNRTQNEILAAAKTRFNIGDAEQKTLLPGIQREIMTEAMREAYREGDPDPETKSFLERLAKELSVTDPDALRAPLTK
jgi:hypothetical protein